MQPTALVNEAFLRLSAAKNIEFRDRGHFLAGAARVMRRYLIDRARRRSGVERVPLEGLPDTALSGRQFDDGPAALARPEPQNNITP